jgi:glycosyltransferase involved in cell wall biosynthesis
MRVLMVSKACVVGIYQRKLEAIARLGVDLHVLVPPVWADPSGPVPLERAHLDGYRLLVEPLRFNGNYHLHYFPSLEQHVRALRPSIIHIDEEPYNLAAWHALWLARRAGARTVFFSWQNIRRRYPPPFSLGEAWVLRTADHAIAGTESAAAVWREKGYRGPLDVIPQFGVDPEQFAPAAPSTDSPDREPAIGFVGRLRYEKGVDLLIHALGRLVAAGQAAALYIAGQGPERPALERLARDLGLAAHVHFLGQMPSAQMAGFYSRMDVVVLPSRTLPNWKEQFGRVLIEAMACGVPVVGSDSAAIPGVIGDGGLVFPEGSADALADRLATLLRDPDQRARISTRGRARVLAHFTHQGVANRTVRVYRAMLRQASDT